MIRIILLGRTGNHLFQYALGRVLAEKHGVPLVLDASWFNAEGWAEVSHFLRLPIQAKVVRRLPLAVRALRKLSGNHYWEYGRFPMLREDPIDQAFDARFLDAPADCLLFGYFQTPIYFESNASGLRRDLNDLIRSGARVAKSSVDESLLERLGAPNSVAVHVRRTDFLTQPIFHVCGSAYYHQAMAEMRALIPGARFFVFSDDPAWCRSAFSDDDTVVIDSGTAAKNPLHDLHLLSLATHHIIANSSYSWWAAWLADKPGQQVIMPDRWYAGEIKAPIEEKRLPHWKLIQSHSR